MKENEVHVWAVDLDAITLTENFFCSSLSHEEKTRRDKLVFERDRKRFALAREIQRRILSHYISVKPESVEYNYNKYGKPEIRSHIKVGFNISHSDGMLLFAIASNRQVGIDIEKIKDIKDILLIAESYFSDIEIKELKNLPDRVKTDAFFTCWTRKEAFIKAIGKGLSYSLKDFSVSVSPASKPELIHPKNGVNSSEWSIFDMSPPDKFKAALIVENFSGVLVCGQLNF